MNKIGTYKFVAEPFHVDFTGRLTLGVLGNHLLNCAGFHATERGFGMATLNEDNYTWVLSRLATASSPTVTSPSPTRTDGASATPAPCGP